MQLYIGLMSGTSLDGLDICLVSIDHTIQLLDSQFLEFPAELRSELLSLCQPCKNELTRLSIAEQEWARLASSGIKQILQRQAISPAAIAAIGSHGQTIRHHPELGFSVQIGAPALLAELTGIRVISHFRQRDLAAGGQGAPLVPAFHHWLFAASGQASAIVNIGGFSNISFILPDEPVSGFDCGPGNVLLDAWVQKNLGVQYDSNGDWARSGTVNQTLLDSFLQQPYFRISGPKSTGRELFNLSWLEQQLIAYPACPAEDVQATLAELTAICISQSVPEQGKALHQLAVCGGGARNSHLLERLAHLLPGLKVVTTDQLGVPADWMEAMAFAWLAHCCLKGVASNRPEVTGARGLRILGAVYPA